MAGYQGYSKSNNAVAAEEDGRYPASTLAKRLGVKTGAIKALMSPSEWHHTSSRYNKTNFYDETEALEMIGDLQAWQEPSKGLEVLEKCNVTWLEWGGTRKHPKATERTIENVVVTIKGEWATFERKVTDSLTISIRKKLTTKGFRVMQGTKMIVDNR